MDELCASRVSDEAGGSHVTNSVTIDEQITVIEQELGGKPETRVRGLGGALRRPPKPRGSARVPRNDAEVEELRRQLAEIFERCKASKMEKEEMKQCMTRLEASLNDVISAQGNPGDNIAAAAATPFVADKSSCASAYIPEEDQD